MDVHGEVAPGFEPVREAFEENFRKRGEVGASVCAYLRGEKVVDLWAGSADPDSGAPWEADTLCVVFSSTKGLVAQCFAVLADRGLDVDEPVANYWPAFSDGRRSITIRQMLNHSAGLSAIDVPLEIEDFRSRYDKVLGALEAQAPREASQAYGATAWGAFTGELFKRIEGRSVGTFFRDEIAGPLGADAHIGLDPKDDHRVARLLPIGGREIVRDILPALTRRDTEGRLFRRLFFDNSSLTGKALKNPRMHRRMNTMNDPRYRRVELPWMGGICSARGLARTYAPFANGGELDGVQIVKPATLEPIMVRQTWKDRDPVLHKPIGWSQGFVKEEAHISSPSPESFGHTGAGGSIGFADPATGFALGYVMNRMDWRIRSPRQIALCQAAYRAMGIPMPRTRGGRPE